MNWPGLWYTLKLGAGLGVFAVAAIFAAEYAVRRWQWAADLAFAVGLISEDDLGDER